MQQLPIHTRKMLTQLTRAFSRVFTFNESSLVLVACIRTRFKMKRLFDGDIFQ